MFILNILKKEDEFKINEIINKFQFNSITKAKEELQNISIALPAVSLEKNKKYYLLLIEKLYEDKPEVLYFTTGYFLEDNSIKNDTFVFNVNTPSGLKNKDFKTRDLMLMEY